MITKRERVSKFIAWLNGLYGGIDAPFTAVLWKDRYVRDKTLGVYMTFTEEYDRAWLNGLYGGIDAPFTAVLWKDRYVRDKTLGVYMTFTEEYDRPPAILIAGRQKTQTIQTTYAHELSHHVICTGYFHPTDYTDEEAAEGNARTLISQYKECIKRKKSRPRIPGVAT